WPEVYYGGIGWVAFEPTPGRGEPGAQGYTGISPQQAGGAIETPTNEATTPGATVPATPGGGTKIENGNQELIPLPNLRGRLGSTKSASSDNASTLERLGLGLLVAALLAVVALVVGAFLRERRWRRRWQSAPSGPDRVLVTWQRTLDGLERAGLPVSPANTPR